MDREALAHLRHELRTPLNHIIGYSEMLLEDVVAADLAALGPGLRQVRHDARQLLDIINHLTHAEAEEADFGRLSAEVAVPLRSVMTEVDRLRVAAERAGAERVALDLNRVASAAAALESAIRGGIVAQPATKTNTAVLSVPPAGGLNTGVILIVDDNASNREMLGRRLEREGHQVQLAASGREALDALRERSVDHAAQVLWVVIHHFDLRAPRLASSTASADSSAASWANSAARSASASGDPSSRAIAARRSAISRRRLIARPPVLAQSRRGCH